jgi:hypothetical protein
VEAVNWSIFGPAITNVKPVEPVLILVVFGALVVPNAVPGKSRVVGLAV